VTHKKELPEIKELFSGSFLAIKRAIFNGVRRKKAKSLITKGFYFENRPQSLIQTRPNISLQ
jgi:hypothetical protein